MKPTSYSFSLKNKESSNLIAAVLAAEAAAAVHVEVAVVNHGQLGRDGPRDLSQLLQRRNMTNVFLSVQSSRVRLCLICEKEGRSTHMRRERVAQTLDELRGARH